jgi:uncharacterized protein (TIGR03437 family)
MRIRSLLSFWLLVLPAFAQEPSITIDANAGRRPISPAVYGINWDFDQENSTPQNAALAAAARSTVRRWGGNPTSRYHWKLDVMNIDADWFFEVLPDTSVDASKLPEGSSFNKAFERWQRTGAQVVGTVPILDWLPKSRDRMCSFSIAKYGRQCSYDYWFQDCGSGIVWQQGCPTPSESNSYSGYSPPNARNVVNDPSDINTRFDESLQRDWVKYVVSKYGKGNQGGVLYWSLDNEPDWWVSTHRDVHPTQQNYDETLAQGLKYARAIKDADPTALVTGPVNAGWQSLFLSFKDIQSGWNAGNYWSNQVDRKAHGGLAFVPWYLQNFRQAGEAEGRRLLDVLDTHAYITPDGVNDNLNGGPGTPAQQALRLQSTRGLWDSTYVYNHISYWVVDIDNNGAPIAPRLIPRMKEWVDQYYPGTKLAITEYDWGAHNTLSGALAQADILGIFGREGLDMATLWAGVKPTYPTAYTFRMFRNFDGIGGAFGETAVQVTGADPDQLGVYAALRSDSMLTVMVINKSKSDVTTNLSLANFNPGPAAKVWRYSAENLSSILPKPDLALSGSSVAAAFPAESITMLVIPPATFAVPQPVVKALQNAGSYSTGPFAPGEMVIVWGTNLGPKQLVSLNSLPPSEKLDANGLVKDNMAGVRILFDGVPGRMVYVREDTCGVVIPYFGAIGSATHVQVEYQGVRSEPFEITVVPTAPGLFTVNSQGFGQGSIQVDNKGTLNSADHPASPGKIVILWLTGEGLTDPPGVDGRLAVDILPKPLAGVTVEVGGKTANVEYAGVAPYNMPGLMQINARLASDVPLGNAVPVRVRIGNNWSQDNVTLVVH